MFESVIRACAVELGLGQSQDATWHISGMESCAEHAHLLSTRTKMASPYQNVPLHIGGHGLYEQGSRLSA